MHHLTFNGVEVLADLVPYTTCTIYSVEKWTGLGEKNACGINVSEGIFGKSLRACKSRGVR
jgi:hypothetical protein